jgi:hypothetical protein
VRTALPIAHWLDDDEAAGGPLGSLVTRLVGGADRTVPAGRRAISVSVRLAAGDTGPTITTPSGTAILAEGALVVLGSDYPNDELPTATISTVAGDDVLVVETFLTP